MSNQIKTVADLLLHFGMPPEPPPVVVSGYQIEPDEREWVVITPNENELFFDREQGAVQYVAKKLARRPRVTA